MTFIPNIYGLISSVNSSSTPLTGSAVFTGTGEDVSDYNSVTLSVYSDVASATNGLSIQFSSDNTNWDFQYNYSISAGNAVQYTLQIPARYLRVVYTNGATSQTSFRLQTIKCNGKNQLETTSYNDGIIQYSNTSLVGLQDDSVNNTIRKIRTDSFGNLNVSINNPLTAFGDLAVAQSKIADNLSFLYNINSVLVTATTSGSGTVTQSTNFAVVNSGATAGSTAVLESNRIINYVAGIGITIRFTAIWTSPGAGKKLFAGFGTTSNGFFFCYDGVNFGICVRDNGTNNIVNQSSWNFDKMDGSGGSGQTLDTTKGNVYMIRFQWLGFGAISFYIENKTTGKFNLVHQVKYTNTNTSTSTRSPNGRLRLEADNGAVASSCSVSSPSMSVQYDSTPPRNIGVNFSISANETTVPASAITSILSIRSKTTFQSVTNSVPSGLLYLSIFTESNRSIRVDVFINATVTGATWTDISTNQSVMEYSSTQATISTGILIQSFFLTKLDAKIIDLTSLEYDITPGNSITFTVYTTSASNLSSLSVSWIERF